MKNLGALLDIIKSSSEANESKAVHDSISAIEKELCGRKGDVKIVLDKFSGYYEEEKSGENNPLCKNRLRELRAIISAGKRVLGI